MVSGSSDGDTIVWNLKDQIPPCILQGNKENVNIVDGLYCAKNRGVTIVVSVSINCTIKIWHRNKVGGTILVNTVFTLMILFKIAEEFNTTQLIDLGYSLGVAVRISFVPQTSSIILAAALDDSSIRLFTNQNPAIDKFTESATLKGHEDWIRGLDFYVDSGKCGSIITFFE